MIQCTMRYADEQECTSNDHGIGTRSNVLSRSYSKSPSNQSAYS